MATPTPPDRILVPVTEYLKLADRLTPMLAAYDDEDLADFTVDVAKAGEGILEVVDRRVGSFGAHQW